MAVQKLKAAVDDANDPLSMLMDLSVDKRVDVNTRMQAAALCLPYLYPRLSEMRIDSKSTVTHVNAADLLDRLDDRIAKLQPGAPPPLIEAEPTLIEAQTDAEDDVDEQGRAGDVAPPDDAPPPCSKPSGSEQTSEHCSKTSLVPCAQG